ncbi:uncharacterized protein GGS22DRAFT_60906 [Annulohypoxylon maeteangense]|uniref:uncharacterized protein n=1 Tax=Annulohypoxylon maeteangense TaxID=1927788 RepID=UPI002007A377|nr:uncharacterized protein GGS22DRAFT_60906 [Annulohypoxylon maeteangense]KAI0888592.1 hypothetical protein GGS22DRAFT_60906 [Annulohypoxylon maeteangense]
MAAPASLPVLLDSLTNSLTSAFEAAPKISGIEPTKDGVSLLDVKNELLLSYLQNLVFLILIKIRNAKNAGSESSEEEDKTDLSDVVVKKLVELRLYLDKGVRPLEEKLQFQLDKILRAVEDADRIASQPVNEAESESESESDDGLEDSDASGNEGPTKPALDISAKRFAPSFANFVTPSNPVGMAATTTQDKTGAYRPPKITPTVMPTTERRERSERRPMKSATMDEYISNELSSMPVAEPSVGTTIMSGGRKMKTASERQEEEHRRNYEESNFVRLPKESKKERTQRNKIEGRSSRMQFGGEEWRDLGEGVDRINRLTRQKEGGRGTKALLEKSRKRTRDTGDSARGSGHSISTKEIGERFNKRVKVMEGGRRDRGKR